jgi:hypothetical protein
MKGMMMTRRALVVLAMASAACAGASKSAADRPNRAVIVDSEMPAGGTETVFDVVQRLRPEYLRQRPQGGSTVLSVFTQGQLLGDATELKRIPVSSVKEIRYYNIEQAKNKFGMQYSGGVIELTYR